MTASTRRPLIAAALFVALLALTQYAAPAADAVVPESDAAALITEDLKRLNEALAGKPTEANINKARWTSLVVALAAQDQAHRGGPNATKHAGLRDAALKILASIPAEGTSAAAWKEAKEAAAKLTPLGAGTDGDPTPVDFSKVTDMPTLMRQFALDRNGGLGLRQEVYLSDKRAPSNADAKRWAIAAYRFALAGPVIQQLVPNKIQGPADATKENWIKWAGNLQPAALEVAKVAKAGKGGNDLKAAMKGLRQQCFDCHSNFERK